MIKPHAGPAGRFLRSLRSADEGAPVAVKLAVPLFAVLALLGIAGYTLVARPLLLAQLQEAYADRALALANAVQAEYAIDPGCDAAAAAAVGARARAAVQQLGIRARGGRLLSASAGIAEHGPTLAAEDLVSSADAALYRAKARGGGVEVAAVTPRAG